MPVFFWCLFEAVFFWLCCLCVVFQREQRRKRLGGLLGLLWEKDGVDVSEDTAGGNGDATEELVELLVVADGELDVARDDALLLVVSGGVTGELEDLSGEVLEDGGEVDWGTSTDASGVAADTKVAVNAADWELKSSLGRARGRFSGFLSTSHGI